MPKSNPAERIAELEKKLAEKDAYIVHLEKLSEAYTNLSDLFNQQLMEADRTIKAQEIIQTMMHDERVEAARTIEAQERLQELAAREKAEAEETIHAHEALLTLTAHEKRDAEETIRAHENLQELTAREMREAEETIRAQENIQILATQEKLQTEGMLEAQKIVANLSEQELRSRDLAIRRILEVNRRISALLEPETLLALILDSLMESIGAARGVLYLEDKEKLVPRILRGITHDDLNSLLFADSGFEIQKAVRDRRVRLERNHNVRVGKTSLTLSIIVVPLVHKDRLLGCLYADIVSDSETFREQDGDVAAIFGSQAAISLSNSTLYGQVRRQNHELLRQVNLKNQFIAGLSDDLSGPVGEIHDVLAALPGLSPEDREKKLARALTTAAKVKNTIAKLLNLVAQEASVDELFRDRVNFREIAEAVLATHEEKRREKNIQVKVHLAPEFETYPANRTIIRIVLDELISNAIYYNKPGGKVDISGSVKEPYLVLQVADTGHGIKPENRERIFEQFARTEDSEKLNSAGAGLGLFMALNSVRSYGGDISLESEYGEGSTFTATFLVQ
jgi:signal transduction histidine kinase